MSDTRIDLNPPLLSAVVTVPESEVGRYEAAGWTRVKKAAARKSRSSDEK